MNNILRDFEEYLKNTLALSTKASPWEGAALLPLFMRELYDFFQVTLLNKPFLLMLGKSNQEQTPATVKKHLVQLSEKWHHDLIYVRSSVSSYNRLRLIEHKIPFVIPGTQMYLPMLGLDLREHFKSLRKERADFSPSTQAVILCILYKKINKTITPLEMSKYLGYSAMTMTRAYEELKSAGIGEHEVRGKKRLLSFSVTGKELWEKALPYLKTPVKKRFYALTLQKKRSGICSGLTALARYSNLAEPKKNVYAYSAEAWHSGEHRLDVSPLPQDDGDMEIELWSYNPALFAGNGMADRLSLFLAFKDTQDERIEEALETLLEDMAW